MDLPSFKYHPDPISTGSVRSSETECACCGAVRGYIYIGPVYAIDEYENCICPWCIADGSAHEKLDATFTDDVGVGGHPGWDPVTQDVIDEVSNRTPGFGGWQQELWWTHCGDAAEFLGRAGRKELEQLGTEALDAIRENTGLDDGPEWTTFLNALERDGAPTAYIFRCRKCGKLGGYQDTD